MRRKWRAAEERHRHAIAIDVAIHQHRDDAVLGEAAADLQRRVHRLPTSMVSAPKACRNSTRRRLIFLARLAHRHDRHGQLERPHQRAADLPVTEMAGDQDDALAARARLHEGAAVQLAVLEELHRLRRRHRDRAEEIEDVLRVAVVGAERQRLDLRRRQVGKGAAEVVGDRAPGAAQGPVGHPRPPNVSAFATGRGRAVASRYMDPKATPVLKTWLVHVARIGADASAGSGRATKRWGADIGRAAGRTLPTV